MSENRESQFLSAEHKFVPYFNQIITAALVIIVSAVPLFCDIHLHSVFDLSKLTILYVLTFTILAIWSIKAMITCKQKTKRQEKKDERREARGEGRERPQPSVVSHPSSLVLRLLNQPLILPLAAYLFVSGLATIFSINPYLSLVGTYARYGGFISTVVYISLFFVIINFADKRKSSILQNIIILTACLASIYGILQHFDLDFHQWNTSFGHRVPSTFGHPAFFSAFLTMVIPFILIKIFSDSHFRYSTFLYMGILMLFLVAFYYTKTRASFLGLIISHLFFFFLIGKKNLLANKVKTIITIALIIGASVFFNINNKASEGYEASVVGRFADDINSGTVDQLGGTMRMRVFQYLTGLKIIHDYPILGIGPDTVGLIYPQYLLKVFKEKDEHRYLKNKKVADRIHNDFLDMGVSRGLLGLGVYVWFIFAYARMVWRGCKKANGYNKILIIGLCSSSLAYFVQNQFSFGHISIITLFWVIIALSVIACPLRNSLSHEGDSIRNLSSQDIHNPIMHEAGRTRQVGSLDNGGFIKRTFYGIIVCLMILFIILSLFRYKADLYFENGRKLLYKNELNDAIQSYKMATKYNPLLLYYRNVLNRIYLKMAVIGFSRDQRNTEEQTNNLSREQTTMLISNAISGAEEVQKIYPGDYHSAFTLGQAYHFLNTIQPVHPGINEGLRAENPDNPGYTNSQKGTSNNAIKYYKKAIILRPFKFEFRNKLAQFYAEQGQYEHAIHELNEAINISPDNQDPYLNLAKVYMTDNERYGDAEATLLAFTKNNPDQEKIDIYRLLSYVYLRTAQWEQVLRQHTRIIKLDQKDLSAYQYAITACMKLEKYDDAQKLCTRLLALSGSQNNTYSTYAKGILKFLAEK